MSLFKKIKVTQKGVYILDSELQKKIKKTNLSPSMIGSWIHSPADWVLDKFILPEVEIQEAIHLKRGTWFHSIMEKFFALEQEDRTKENLLKITKEVSQNDVYVEFAKNEENQEWLKRALRAYNVTWLDNAKNQKVAKLYINGKSQEGLELFIDGKIGNAQRRCLGFIDQILEGENGLIVNDWKTGAKISNYNPDLPESKDNPFDYWRQQTFYAMLLENKNAKVEKTTLTFPCSEIPTIITVDHNREDVRRKVIEDVELVDKELEEAINNKFFFEFRKGPYNNWSSWLGGLGNARKPEVYEDKFQMIADLTELM